MSQTWEHGEKTNVGPDFGSLDPKFAPTPTPQIFFLGITSTRC